MIGACEFAAAIERFAGRVDMPDASDLSLILELSRQLGSAVAGALMEYATVMRTSLKHRAETQAQRAGFWKICPSIFRKWTPAFFEFKERQQRNRELMLEGKDNDSDRYGPYLKNQQNSGKMPADPDSPAP